MAGVSVPPPRAPPAQVRKLRPRRLLDVTRADPDLLQSLRVDLARTFLEFTPRHPRQETKQHNHSVGGTGSEADDTD